MFLFFLYHFFQKHVLRRPSSDILEIFAYYVAILNKKLLYAIFLKGPKITEDQKIHISSKRIAPSFCNGKEYII